MVQPATRLLDRIESGKNVLLLELSPPRGVDPAPLGELARRAAGRVHALAISDNRDHVAMAALAAASLVAAGGAEPILHITTRDRNRVALVSEALGAQALGIRNLLCTSGTHQTLGRFRAAKNVYDIDCIQLLQACAGLAQDGALVGEGGIEGAGPFCLGAVASPDADPLELQMTRLAKKARAGARFLVTQPVYDLERFGVWWQEVARRGLHQQVAIVAGIQPLSGGHLADVQAGRRLAWRVPEAVLARVASAAGPAAQRQAAVELAVETIGRLAEFRGLRGFCVSADGDPEAAFEVLEKSGLGEQLTVPAKYAIHTTPAAPRVRPVGKLGIVDWREDCSSCHNCVKRACVYGLYRDEADTLRTEVGYLDYIYQCKGCLSCVQNCTKNILTRVVNPEYRLLGDSYYTPDIIVATWFQAESGRIPVSGSGYGGPFCGPGFDSMWTDMSEIVRPTRDGIHGREYISTSVDVGRKLSYLKFADGQPLDTPPPVMETPMPVIFERIPAHWRRGPVVDAVVAAAAQLGTLAITGPGDLRPSDASPPRHVVPLVQTTDATKHWSDPWPPMVMIPDGLDVAETRDWLKNRSPQTMVAIRVPASPAAAGRVVELTRDGAEVIHLVFDRHGQEQEAAAPRHVRDVLREVHGALVKQGVRDEVTLIASGGIALAEHVPKAIICGADLVAIDVPLLLALECRLCGECERADGREGDEPDSLCPIALEQADAEYAAHRIVNLMGAWHQQLIEVLGAMGIREVRRLRGETGRAMFFEDLERETFGKLFGKRKGLGIGD